MVSGIWAALLVMGVPPGGVFSSGTLAARRAGYLDRLVTDRATAEEILTRL